MQDITSKMNEYNKIIAKYQMAELYYDNQKIKLEDKEKFNSKLQQVVKQVGAYLKEFDRNKIEYTDTEALEGFNVEFRSLRYEKYGY
jgi:DNA integrity scanning protein DisA with diadenylate cyclase activity